MKSIIYKYITDYLSINTGLNSNSIHRFANNVCDEIKRVNSLESATKFAKKNKYWHDKRTGKNPPIFDHIELVKFAELFLKSKQ